MINIRINKETKQIPTMGELTVKQFHELSKLDINIVNYLSVCLEMSYKEAFNIKAKGLDKLLKRLGTLEDYTKIVPKKVIIRNQVIDVKQISIETVGQRFMIEENARSMENEELLCFIMAMGIIDDPMDIEKVNDLKDELMDMPYKNILPSAFFLASRFLIGRNSAMNYLKMFRQLINMKVNESKQALSGLLHTLTLMRFKRYANY